MSDKGNARQIIVYQTNKYLLEANDFLKVIDSPLYASNIHHKRSKIQLLALDYSKPQHTGAMVNVDPSKFLLLAHDVLHNTFSGDYSETKLLSHTARQDGKVRTNLFRVMFRSVDSNGQPVKMPWVVHLENGWSTPVKTELGGTYAQKGSYELDKNDQGLPKSVKVFFSYDDFRRFVLVVRNYIQMFEASVFPYVLKMRHQYEHEQAQQS